MQRAVSNISTPMGNRFAPIRAINRAHTISALSGGCVGHGFLQFSSSTASRFWVGGLPEGAAWKAPRQPDKLADLADFFRERFACEFLAHLQFHSVGSFNLCRCRMVSNCVLLRSACWRI